MRENFVITWSCVRLFPPTSITLTSITEKGERARAKLTKQNKNKKRKETKFIAEEKNIKKFKVAMRKWQMLAARKVKMSGSETKMERRNIYDFFSIKRATRTFHVRWSRAKQWQRNVQKNVLHVQTFFFALKPYWFFLLFSLPSPVSITRFLFFFFLGYNFEYINESELRF